MKIIFDGNFPTQLRKEFEDILNEYKALVPPWLKRLTVHFGVSDEQMKNAALEMLAQEEYRSADMVVYAPYLSITDLEYKKLCILHELCHNFYDRLRNTAYNIVGLLPEESVQKLAAEQIRAADESVTQDLAEAFTEILKNGKSSEKGSSKAKNSKKEAGTGSRKVQKTVSRTKK